MFEIMGITIYRLVEPDIPNDELELEVSGGDLCYYSRVCCH